MKDAIISRNLLLMVSNLLTSHGKPFIDLLHNYSSNRQFRVGQELYLADVLIFLESNSARQSKWVNWELKQAQNLDIPIIQIKIDNGMIPAKLEKVMRENLVLLKEW